MPKQERAFRLAPGRFDPSTIKRIGVRRAWVSDIYHFLLDATWRRLLGLIIAMYLFANVCFGFLYWLIPGQIANARPGSFQDAFAFSVQTMATIGYGYMAPIGGAAQAIVTAEALFGLIGIAVTTSIVFAKFARPTARVLFSRVAVLTTRDGVESLMFRMANERGNRIVEATVRVSLVRNEVSTEGEQLRRVHDLVLLRSSSAIFALTWTAIHPITADSPLHGKSAKELADQQVEIIVSVTGVDETLSQPIYTRHSYQAEDLVWNARLADILSTQADGTRVIDYTRFHDVTPQVKSDVPPRP